MESCLLVLLLSFLSLFFSDYGVGSRLDGLKSGGSGILAQKAKGVLISFNDVSSGIHQTAGFYCVVY